MKPFRIRKIIVRGVDGYTFLPFNSIEFIQAKDGGATFYLVNGKAINSIDTFEYLQNFLKVHGFYKVHPEYLINIQMIQSYDPDQAFFATKRGSIVPTDHDIILELMRELNIGALGMV